MVCYVCVFVVLVGCVVVCDDFDCVVVEIDEFVEECVEFDWCIVIVVWVCDYCFVVCCVDLVDCVG